MTEFSRIEVGRQTVSERLGRTTSFYVGLFCLFVSLVLKPMYLWTSGTMQVSDFLAVGMFLAIPILARAGRGSSIGIATSGILFVAWTILINSIWALQINDASLLLHSAYYAFDLLLYMAVLSLFVLNGRMVASTILWAICIAIAVQWCVYIFGADSPVGSDRGALMFNNPNQLAYWSLCSIGICIALLDQRPRSWPIEIPIVIACLGLLAISLSKAGLISFAALILVRYWNKPKLMIPIGGILALIIWLQWGEGGNQYADRVLSRLADLGRQEDDSLVGRGYGRILEHPQYLALGAGEGAYSRYRDYSFELHSTLGSIVFCYGFVGLFLFGRLLKDVCGSRFVRNGVYLLPAMLYGLTHQGLRFSTFWVLLAVVHSLQATETDQSVVSPGGVEQA